DDATDATDDATDDAADDAEVAGTWHGDRPIIFGDYNWDSILLFNRLAQFILEEGYGYETSTIPGETIPLFQAQLDGEIDLSMEIGEQQVAPYTPALDAGDVVSLGASLDDVVQGWWVPTYMIEGDEERGIEATAPGLEHVDDLPDHWEAFQDPEDPEKGRIYDGVPGWEGERVQEVKFYYYGLDEYYNRFLPGSGAALDTSLITAYERGEPWLGYTWVPTWVAGQVEITLLEEPEYSDECWDEVQEAAMEGRATEMACAWPVVTGDIVSTPEFAEEAPDVVAFLEEFYVDIDVVNESLAHMAETDVDHDEAALWFLEEYEDLWSDWVPEDVADRVRDALQ
ncbi:MAG: ABC transporter substrate-binding protein, partial [Sphaerobacteraceae bacterium]